MDKMELAVSVVRPASIDWLSERAEARAGRWCDIVGSAALAAWLGPIEATHLYFGSEFCEFLLPSPQALRRAVKAAKAGRLKLTLLTPIASTALVRQLSALLPMLPDASEVVVNDWGVAYMLQRDFPKLVRVAGRILCRMVKDPRLSPEWAHHCAHGLDSEHLQTVISRLGITKIEFDCPMFPSPDAFSGIPLAKGVHLPFSYVAKGRTCRFGALSRHGPERFAPGQACRKECLSLVAETVRPDAAGQRATFHLGNTVFTRHTDDMIRSVMRAAESGAIERLIVPGEVQ